MTLLKTSKINPFQSAPKELDLERRLNLTREKSIESNILKEMDNPLTRDEYIAASQKHGSTQTDNSRLLSQDSIVRQKDILKKFGWDKELREIEEGRGQNMDRESEEKSYGNTTAFFEDEIKEICMDFGMRILPVKHILWYTTDFKYEIVEEIDRFCALMKKNMGVDYEAEKFYALAIEEDFDVKGRTKPASKEPRLMMFYKTSDSKNTFVPVKTWGSTKYSIFRYLTSWRKRSALNYFWANAFMGFGLSFMLLPMMSSMGFVANVFVSAALGIGASFGMLHLALNNKKVKKFTNKQFNQIKWES